MIREIINFTNDLLADYPKIEQVKKKPDPGLHVFVDIDKDGNWTNELLVKGKDYVYFNGKNTDIAMWNECIRYQEASAYITMNKVKSFDPKQKIHSCSPFSVAYNFNFNDEDKKSLGIKKTKKGERLSDAEKKENNKKIKQERWKIVKESIEAYKRNSMSIYQITGSEYESMVNNFYKVYDNIIENITKHVEEYDLLSEKDYIHVYLRSIPIEVQEEYHNNYVQDNLLNNKVNETTGTIGFLTSYNSKKPFLNHLTGITPQGYNQLSSNDDALMLFKFEKMWKRKCFPNPLPIIVDKRELNKKMVKLFNDIDKPFSYHEIIRELFAESNCKDKPCYYLLNSTGMQINDLDFVPIFRYELGRTIENIMESGYPKDGKFEETPSVRLDNIFDFERVVARTIFNNALVKITDESYTTNYFGEINPKYVKGGHFMRQLIIKYRKAFYDFIYKSQQNAITASMFDDMMYESILSNVRYDKVKTKYFSNNNNIKDKLNIWFSLYDYFNKNEIYMTSKVKELKDKIRAIASGEADITSAEEFAFAAGQLVSYLLDRSVASDKDYSMLEPYLQKAKSAQLQDAIAHAITIYKHDIKIYKGKFENLASNVLADGSNVEMKPLLKFFLAGCFCSCVIYEKRNND